MFFSFIITIRLSINISIIAELVQIHTRTHNHVLLAIQGQPGRCDHHNHIITLVMNMMARNTAAVMVAMLTAMLTTER